MSVAFLFTLAGLIMSGSSSRLLKNKPTDINVVSCQTMAVSHSGSPAPTASPRHLDGERRKSKYLTWYYWNSPTGT